MKSFRLVLSLLALLTVLIVFTVPAAPAAAQTVALGSPQGDATFEVRETDGSAILRVVFDDSARRLSEPATLSLVKWGGTAFPGSDYQPRFVLTEPVPGVVDALRSVPQRLVFGRELAGSKVELDIVVPLLDDQTPELVEHIDFSFEVSGGASLEGSARVIVSILDNDGDPDLPAVSFSPPGLGLASYKYDLRPLGPDSVLEHPGLELSAPSDRTVHVVLRNITFEKTHHLLFHPGDTFASVPLSIPRESVEDVNVALEIESVTGALIGSPSRALVRFLPGEDHCSVNMLRWLTCLIRDGPSRDEYCITTLPSATRALGPLLSAASGTTALGLLETLTALRDEVLSTTAAGRYYTALYEDLSPAIIDTMVERLDLATLLIDLQEYWRLAFDAFLDGQGDGFPLTQVVVDQLNTMLDKLETGQDASLRAIVRRERQRLDLDSFVGLTMDQAWDRINQRVVPERCQPEAGALCLNDGRFRVEVEWTDFEGKTGLGNAGTLSDESGTFWFFDQANVELIVKVLDGTSINDHFWVFYGALSNVEYTLTVTDTELGTVRWYRNPAGEFASRGDITALPVDRPAQSTLGQVTELATSWLGETARDWSGRLAEWLGARLERTESHSLRASDFATPVSSTSASWRSAQGQTAAGSCVPDQRRLCLNESRFAVEVEWLDTQGQPAAGIAAPLTADTGSFWFFGPENTELVVKVLDGRGINQHFWVFYGALSNVEYTLTVTDTVTGKQRAYSNPRGRFASGGDVDAFAQ